MFLLNPELHQRLFHTHLPTSCRGDAHVDLKKEISGVGVKRPGCILCVRVFYPNVPT